MERPSLHLAVEVTDAQGTRYLWEPDDPSGSRPTDISWSTRRGEGFERGSCSLAWPFTLDRSDVGLFNDVRVLGAGGRVGYEGMIVHTPRSTGRIQVQAVGHMAATKLRKFREVYVDRDLGQWTQASLQRRINLAANSVKDPSVVWDETQRALELMFEAPWTVPGGAPDAEAWYDAGPGVVIGLVYYEWTKHTNVDAADTGYSWLVRLSTDAVLTASDSSGNLRAAGPGSGTLTATASNRRYALIQFEHTVNNSGGASGKQFAIRWQDVAVYGNHGLTLIGDTDPKGVAASDVIRDLIARFCPTLNADGVEDTTWPIPHLVFRERTFPHDAFLEVNKPHLHSLACWEQKTVHYKPYDLTEPADWVVRLDDPNVSVDLQGDSTDDLANGIVVRYFDLARGAQHEITPDDRDELRDDSPENPANAHGLEVWTELELSTPTMEDTAAEIGRAWLAEFNRPKAPGTITIKGWVRDHSGAWHPAYMVRSDDTIAIEDHPNERPRLVYETQYQHGGDGGGTLTAAVEGPMPRMDAYFDRQSIALEAENLR